MNVLDWNLDEMVGKVMADLRKSAADTTARAVGSALTRDFQNARNALVAQDKQTEQVAAPQNDPPDAMTIEERVLVLETVRRLAEKTTAKRWILPQGAVTTPSAKDEAKKRGIELILVAASSVAARGATLSSSTATKTTERELPEVLLISHSTSGARAPRGLEEFLTRNARTTIESYDCLKKSSQRVAEAIAANPTLKAIITTRDSAIATVWANRLQGVRAIPAFSIEQARRDATAANANALIVNPEDLGAYQQRRAVEFFLKLPSK